MIKKLKYCILVVFVALLFQPLQSQEQVNKEAETTRLLFVFDASQSMFGRWNHQQKIFAAREILSNFMDSLQSVENVEVAFRVFGDQYHVPPQVCEDSRLIVPFGKKNTNKIKKALKDIVPKGTTPISYALEMAAGDFPDDDHCRNIIVLITDGIEECDGDPCEVSLRLQAKGIMLKPFVIGIGKDFKGQYDCVGTFIEAKTEEDFLTGLNVMITQALNNTTAQVNLLDANHKPTTTNVTVSIYEHHTKLVKHNFIHTMNAFGVPDTIYLDPRHVYDVVAHTIPEVRMDSVVINDAEHNTIALKAPVGTLHLEINSREPISGLQALIRKPDSKLTLNVQQFGQKEIYLTGYYQLEVLSLPRLIIDSVLISQNHITNVDIPGPGILTIKKPGLGYGSIFEETKEGLKWVYRFRNEINHIESLYLLPGIYRVVYRNKFSNSTLESIEKRFRIKTGESIILDLNK